MSTEFNVALETLRMQKSAAAKVQDWQSRDASETSDIQVDKPKAAAPMTDDKLNVQAGASISPAELEGVCFYPYDAIAKKWESFLVWKGVTKTFPRKFLSQNALVSGSTEAKGDPIWSQSHVFYKCVEANTGSTGLYFIDSDISSLLDILISQQPTLNRTLLLPNPARKIPSSTFESIEKITFATTAELQAFRMKQIPRGDTTLLSLNKKAFARFQEEKFGAVMAIDIESWERNHAYILEIGWSSISFFKDPKTEELVETRSSEHILISDYSHLKNGQYTPNNKHRFNYGQSEELTLKKTIRLLSSILDEHLSNGPLFLVFHSASSEKAYFETIGIDTSKWVTGLPDPSFWDDPNSPANKDDNEIRLRNGVVYIMDTQKLFNASGLPQAQRQIGLENALKALGIPARNLHNAGNDACYTLALYDALVGEGVMKQELIAENASRMAKIKPKGKQGWYSGWE